MASSATMTRQPRRRDTSHRSASSEWRRVDAAVPCAGRRESALEQCDPLHRHHRLQAHRSRHPRQRASPLDRERSAHSRQRDVRSKRPTLDLESRLLARQLEVVVQQLESRLLLYPDPYDPCPPKVRKGADLADGDLERRVPGRGAIGRRDQRRCGRLVARRRETSTSDGDARDAPTPARALRRAAAPSLVPAGPAARRQAQSRRRGASVPRSPAPRRSFGSSIATCVNPCVRASARTARLVSGDWSAATLSWIGQQQGEADRALPASTAPPARRAPRPAPPHSGQSDRRARAPSRDHAVEDVQRPRAEASEIERDARESRGEQRLTQRLEARRLHPARQLVGAQLDARQVLVVPHAEVAGDAQRPQPPPRHARSARGVLASPRSRTAAATRGRATKAVARSGRRVARERISNVLLGEPEIGERTGDAVLASGLRARPPIGEVVGVRAVGDRLEARARGRPARACSRAPSCRSSTDCSGWPRTAGRRAPRCPARARERRTTAPRLAPPSTAPRGRTRCDR